MPSANRKQIEDLLNRAILGNGDTQYPTPIPLISTSYHASIEGGLATVEETRTFRNFERQSIEATMTLPMPVHAVLYKLEAHIGETKLIGRAIANTEARKEYEGNIELGRMTVLHEEVLRGIHKISVGQLPPGAEVVIRTAWVSSMAFVRDEACLRIPVTVGDIYGQSPLIECDDLIHDDVILKGTLSIETDSGRVTLNDRPYDGKERTITLNRPIDIRVRNWKPLTIVTRNKDNQHIALTITPAPVADTRISAALLVDTSGSMGEASQLTDRISTKLDAVRSGLLDASEDLRAGDEITLFEFSDRTVQYDTTVDPQAFRELLGKIGPPSGGTHIGNALQQAVLASSISNDIVIITDGKSHALDVQSLVRTGRRFSAVLVGEDSLEANVGHLAALSGGNVFVALDGDAAGAISSLFRAIRSPANNNSTQKDNLKTISLHRCGMKLAVELQSNAPSPSSAQENHGARALVASLLIPRLHQSDAIQLARTEGIVCHLMSLVLFDNTNQPCLGPPNTRTLSLMTPATHHVRQNFAHAAVNGMPARTTVERRKAKRSVQFRGACKKIDWKLLASEDSGLNFGLLPGEVVAKIFLGTKNVRVVRLASQLDISKSKLLIAVLAKSYAHVDAHADLLAKNILGPISLETERKIADLATEFGLECETM